MNYTSGMKNIKGICYGKLISATDLDGNIYSDWRKEKIDVYGKMYIARSKQLKEGQLFIFFGVAYREGAKIKDYRTEPGNLIEKDNLLILQTDNCIYAFEIDMI